MMVALDFTHMKHRNHPSKLFLYVMDQGLQGQVRYNWTIYALEELKAALKNKKAKKVACGPILQQLFLNQYYGGVELLAKTQEEFDATARWKKQGGSEE